MKRDVAWIQPREPIPLQRSNRSKHITYGRTKRLCGIIIIIKKKRKERAAWSQENETQYRTVSITPQRQPPPRRPCGTTSSSTRPSARPPTSAAAASSTPPQRHSHQCGSSATNASQKYPRESPSSWTTADASKTLPAWAEKSPPSERHYVAFQTHGSWTDKTSKTTLISV